MMPLVSTAIEMVYLTDPEQVAAARAQRGRFDRNAAWFQSHAHEIFTRHRGRCVCVAGEELFVSDTPTEARALALAAHPDDDGMFVQYVPRQRLSRIYAV